MASVDKVTDFSKCDIVKTIRQLCDILGFDIVIECFGALPGNDVTFNFNDTFYQGIVKTLNLATPNKNGGIKCSPEKNSLSITQQW